MKFRRLGFGTSFACWECVEDSIAKGLAGPILVFWCFFCWVLHHRKFHLPGWMLLDDLGEVRPAHQRDWGGRQVAGARTMRRARPVLMSFVSRSLELEHKKSYSLRERSIVMTQDSKNQRPKLA